MDIVVAVYENWGIGKDGTQPVVVSADRKHFREITGHGAVIVGRKTLAYFPGGKPLKNRRNIILTRDESLQIEGAETAHSVEDALRLTRDEDDAFVIGGESVYRALLPYCTRAHLTVIYATPECDAFFPNLDETPGWRVEDEGTMMEENGVKFRFVSYFNENPAQIS